MMEDDDYEFPEDSANYEDEAFEEDNGTQPAAKPPIRSASNEESGFVEFSLQQDDSFLHDGASNQPLKKDPPV